MGQEDFQRFITRFQEDTEFRERLENAESDEERQAITQAEGYHFTRADLGIGDSGELSEDEVAAAAGGTATDTTALRWLIQ